MRTPKGTNKLSRRISALLLCVVMLAGIMPTTALAASTPKYGSRTFDMYYLVGDNYPNPLYEGGLAENYGPGQNDTPFLRVTVDVDALVTKLKAQYPGETVVEHNYAGERNTWALTPALCGITDPSNYAEWWAVVVECMTDRSRAEYEAHDLSDIFVGYVLKNQHYYGDYHLDGKLTVKPPVYIVELYLKEVGSSDYSVSTITKSGNNPAMTMDKVQAKFIEQLETELGASEVVVDWDNSTFTADGTLYSFTVTATPGDNDIADSAEEVEFNKRSNDLYRATFTLEYDELPLYTVTYTDGVNGEVVFEDQEYSDLLAGTKTPDFVGTPTREGYVFAGWQPTVADTVTESVTYAAQWKVDENGNGTPDDEEDKYTVTYTDGVDGEEVFADQVHNNLLAGTKTPDFVGTPTREGYVFAGWNPTVAETVTESVTYVAQWTPIMYTVAFNANGHGTAPESQSVQHGSTATKPADLTADGWVFGGWYTDKTCTTAYDFATPVTADITLYAKWNPKPTPINPGNKVAYIVEHYKADHTAESGYTIADTERLTGTIGEEVTATPKTYEGYKYNASISTASATLVKITSAEDIVTLKLYYDVTSTPISPGNKVAYIVEHYKADHTTVSGYTLAETERLTGTIGEEVTATPKTYEGYKYNAGISTASGTLVKITSAEDIVTLKLYYDETATPINPGNKVAYIVEHYKADHTAVGGYTLADTERLTGTIGEEVTATPKTYEGYKYNPTISTASATLVKITSAEDIVTLKLYYDVTSTPINPGNKVAYVVEHYKADYTAASGYTLADTERLTGTIGEEVTATPKTYEGYKYNASISTASGTLVKITSAEDIVTLKLYYDVTSTPINPGNKVAYIVEHYKADHTAESSYTLADTERLTGTIGEEVTATPKTYEGYKYNASISTASATLVKITSAEDIVTLKLYYDVTSTPINPGNKVAYIIEHYKADHTAVGGYALADTERLTGTIGEEVTATPKTYEGYKYNASISTASATLVKITSAEDIVTLKLYYDVTSTPINPGNKVAYIVEHYKADHTAASGYTLADTERLTGTIGEEVTATPKTYEGYKYNPAISTASGALVKITSAADIVTLKLYYDVTSTPINPGNKVAYIVEHYKADHESESGYTLADTERLTGTIGEEVTATPKTYEGYKYNADISTASATLVKITSAEDIVTLKLYYDVTSSPINPGNKVAYIVQHYKADHTAVGGYALADTERLTGTIGEEVTATPKTYEGYKYNASISTASGTLVKITTEADIVTLKLYYDTAYTLTYDANGGTGAPEDGSDYAAGESVTLSDERPVRGEYAFIGWSLTADAKIYSAGEALPKLVKEVTFADADITVYAVWGYDSNGDRVADAEQVLITPADLTIYPGGEGFEGIVTGTGGNAAGSGFPEPGYYLILPHELNEKIWEVAGADAYIDLSEHFAFAYSENGLTRRWDIERYDAGGESLTSAGRYVYRIKPDEVTGINVQLGIYNDNGELVPSSDFTPDESIYAEYDMTIYNGEIEQTNVELVWKTAPGGDVSTGYTTCVGTGKLTVRGVSEDIGGASDLMNSAPAADLGEHSIKALAREGNEYHINQSPLQTAADESVKLLVDDILGGEEQFASAAAEALRAEGITLENAQYVTRYLDLVDADNGNAYLTLGEGQSIDIYWGLPDNVKDVYIVHIEGLDRNYEIESFAAELANAEKIVYGEDSNNALTIENGNASFETSTFSPFVLVYTTEEQDVPVIPDRVRLRYESNGGTEYADEWYERGTLVRLDKVPAREGYTFIGWFADKELTERIDYVRMDSDKIVYAGWRASGVPEWLNGDDHFAYVIGYEDGTVKPLASISRSETAAIIFRLLKPEVRDKYLTDENPFEDVTEGMWCNKAISTLYTLGILNGRTETRFEPDAPISRAEFAAICARFDSGAVDKLSSFTDISGHWAEKEIERAAARGWIMGYDDGSFRPNALITRAEAVTMINRVLQRIPEDEDSLLANMRTWPDNKPGAWYYLAVQEATNSHTYERIPHAITERWLTLTPDPDWTQYQT